MVSEVSVCVCCSIAFRPVERQNITAEARERGKLHAHLMEAREEKGRGRS
jgi:phage gp36-like protein